MHSMDIYNSTNNHKYLSRHPEIERFYMPKTFYFRYLPDKMEIHWAIIVPQNSGYRPRVTVYFINSFGRVFDKLEFKHEKIARRRLRKCGFDYSTNRYCKETPREPIYIQLSEGKKSAPYSRGNLFQSVQRDRKNPDKYKDSYDKAWRTWNRRTERWNKEWLEERKRHIINRSQGNKPVIQNNSIDLEILIYFIILAFFITLFIICMIG